MPYCSDCGVEVEEYVEVCPLCATPIRNGGDAKAKLEKYPDRPVTENRSGIFRLLAWETVSVFLLTASFIVVFTNLLIDFSITWAWYPLASFTLAWLLVTFPLLLYGKPVPISVFSVAAILAFLAFVDFIDNGSIDWFYYIALPIAVVIGIVTILVIFLSSKAKKKGANIAAFILFGVGVVILGLDAIIGFALYRTIGLGWSYFVIIPIVFIALFLLYIHHRLLREVNLKKWFQI
jgi:hypothetical protein